jgi:hypothetical protein
MSTFDPARIFKLAKTLESGTLEERLAVIEDIDSTDLVASGILMRALDDDTVEVRLLALEKLHGAGVRPLDMVLEKLLVDDDERVRTLAEELRDRPDAQNPLDQLVPQIEKLSGALGPLGGVLRDMVGTLRGIGATDERTQLETLSQLTDNDPSAILAVQQALQSPFISVQLAALNRARDLDSVTVPESLMGRFLADPSDEIRTAASEVMEAGKVSEFDADEFRAQMMQRMAGGLLQGLGGAGGGAGGFDLSSLFGGGGMDISSLMEAFGGGAAPEPASSSEPADNPEPHLPDGRTYLVADERALKRVVMAITRLTDSETPPAQLKLAEGTPPAWAVDCIPIDGPPPRWVESVTECGLECDEALVGRAEQARRVSEQVWGAAYGDHVGDRPLTLVFHDGMLSRAEWAGSEPGGYASGDTAVMATAHGPLELLSAFFADPTDDRLVL